MGTPIKEGHSEGVLPPHSSPSRWTCRSPGARSHTAGRLRSTTRHAVSGSRVFTHPPPFPSSTRPAPHHPLQPISLPRPRVHVRTQTRTHTRTCTHGHAHTPPLPTSPSFQANLPHPRFHWTEPKAGPPTVTAHVLDTPESRKERLQFERIKKQGQGFLSPPPHRACSSHTAVLYDVLAVCIPRAKDTSRPLRRQRAASPVPGKRWGYTDSLHLLHRSLAKLSRKGVR